MKSPNLLIIGAQKCGTSTIHNILEKHPQISASKSKELHYFDDFYHTKNLTSYTNSFDERPTVKYYLESTPIYLNYPGCAEKIFTILGNIPLIVSVRDPIKRAYSQYWHNKKYGFEKLPFIDAIDAEEKRRLKLGLDFYRFYAYTDRSAYFKRISYFKNSFSRIHVIKFENLVSCPIEETMKIFDFLDIKSTEVETALHKSNPSGIARSKLINRIINEFEHHFKPNQFSMLLRRCNFKQFDYPEISKEEEEYFIQHLNKKCPKTLKYYEYG